MGIEMENRFQTRTEAIAEETGSKRRKAENISNG